VKDSSGIILHRKDKEMLEAVLEYQTKNNLSGIKRFHLQGILGWYNTTFDLRLKRLTENRLLQHTSNGLIEITKFGKIECVKPLIEANMPVAKREKRNPSKREREVIRKEKIKFHLLYHAASGVMFEKVISEDREFHTKPIKVTPSTTMTELLLNQVIACRPFTPVNEVLLNTVKGVTLDDFFSRIIVSPIFLNTHYTNSDSKDQK
jgi:hypothetical protein